MEAMESPRDSTAAMRASHERHSIQGMSPKDTTADEMI